MNRFWIVAVLAVPSVLCAPPIPVLAQGITGIVRDANTSQPLAGVLVSVLDVVGGRVRGVLTDADGRFVIEVPMGRYRLRSERIGLRPETSEPFDLNTFNLRVEQIVMTIRAVEIAGLVVDTRIKSCRIDPDAALRIQRWWEEIKTALAVSSVLQRQRFATFKIEKFEREWSDDLTRVVDCISRVELSQSSRPFLSAGADFLSEGGFVQGDIDSQRQYYAPEADVLLSDVFLSEHCFSLVEDSDRDDQLGLHFEPVEMRTVPEILGTLWVDTTTAELQNLDFRYTNLDGVGQGEAGGLVAFEYLPSGAWIVSEWYIHMPRVGVRIESRRNDEVPDYLLLGFVDVGGEVTPLVISDEVEEGGPVGAIRGVVFDSIGGGGLVDATVTIVGTGRQATTDAAGEFILINVPIGPHNLTFFRADTDAWGLGLLPHRGRGEGELHGGGEARHPPFQASRVGSLSRRGTRGADGSRRAHSWSRPSRPVQRGSRAFVDAPGRSRPVRFRPDRFGRLLRRMHDSGRGGAHRAGRSRRTVDRRVRGSASTSHDHLSGGVVHPLAGVPPRVRGACSGIGILGGFD